MALSWAHLVTSITNPRVVKGTPDCSKTKFTVRLHPREYFPAFLPIVVRMRDWLFSSEFSDLNFASYVLYHFTRVMSLVTHSGPGLSMHCIEGHMLNVDQIANYTGIAIYNTAISRSKSKMN